MTLLVALMKLRSTCAQTSAGAVGGGVELPAGVGEIVGYGTTVVVTVGVSKEPSAVVVMAIEVGDSVCSIGAVSPVSVGMATCVSNGKKGS